MMTTEWLLLISLLVQGAMGAPMCQRVVTYEEIQQLLVHSPCAVDIERVKRGSETGSSNHIYALKSVVNDHRTIIDDHRTMINYLMNNTVNITQLNQHFAEQHMKRRPIWNSWRDVSLILLLSIVVSMVIYLLVVQLKPLEILTAFFVRRHQTHQRRPTIKNEKKMNPMRLDLSEIESEMRY